VSLAAKMEVMIRNPQLEKTHPRVPEGTLSSARIVCFPEGLDPTLGPRKGVILQAGEVTYH